MGDLTKNISRHEVTCKCGKCSYQSIDYQTLMMVQGACDYFSDKLGKQVTLIISSGQRCPVHNENEGGAKNSYHLQGGAIDHYIKEVPRQELYNYYCTRYPKRFGFGLYLNKNTPFVHADSRSGTPWRKVYPKKG